MGAVLPPHAPAVYQRGSDRFRRRRRNLYAYVANSPIDLDDPLGIDAWSDWGNLAAGFGDTLTLGVTAWIRGLWAREFGLPDTVDATSTWNLAGLKTAHAWDATKCAQNVPVRSAFVIIPEHSSA